MRDIDNYAYSCWIVGNEEHARICYGKTPGQAKMEYFTHVSDVVPDLDYKDLRARKAEAPWTGDDFRRVANMRGMPWAQVGQTVKVYGEMGIIVGTYDANFKLLMTTGPRTGLTGNYHPHDGVMVCIEDEKLDLEYPPIPKNWRERTQGEIGGVH